MRIIKVASAVLLTISTSIALAAPPKVLVTHNLTDVDSNAFIAGTIPSQHPTKAHSDNKVIWASVRVACYGHIVAGRCSAMIKMETNTATPVELGMVSINLANGDIEPKLLEANGYRMTVDGPAETTLSRM